MTPAPSGSHGRPARDSSRLLRVFARVQPGEAGTVVLLMLTLFLLLMSYYILKTVREPLILVTGGAELKSYTAAAQAVILLLVVPLYSALVNRVGRVRLINRVGLFFVANILVFYLLAQFEVPYLGVPFFIWVGIFSLMVIAQLWSFANDLYTPEQGKRLFALIAVGSSLGAIVGAWFAGVLLELGLTVHEMMLAAAVLLLLAVGLTAVVQRRERARIAALGALRQPGPREAAASRSGFALVLGDRYLLLIALLILVLNVVNTTGEFILGRTVRDAALAAWPDGTEMQLNAFIGGFYADFFTVVNLLGAVLQMFAVSRILGRVGVGGSLLVLPVIALAGYSLLAVAPALLLIRIVKTLENATDYSLQNTLRQALFLPTSAEAKYKAKQAIDTFCVRLGDVTSAGVVFVGTSLGLATAGFALFNAGLVLVWLALALAIGRRYRQLATAGPDEAAGASAATAQRPRRGGPPTGAALVLGLLVAAAPPASSAGTGPAPADSLALVAADSTAPGSAVHPGPVPLTTLRGTSTLPGREGTVLQQAGHWLLMPPYYALSLAMWPLEEITALNERHHLLTRLARLFVWRVDPVDTDFSLTFGYDSHLGLSAVGLRTTAPDWLTSGLDLHVEAAYLTPAKNFLLLAWSTQRGPLRYTLTGSREQDWKLNFFGLGTDGPSERTRTDRRLEVADLEVVWPPAAGQTLSLGIYTRRQKLSDPSHGRPLATVYPEDWERARRAHYDGVELDWQWDTRPDGELSHHGGHLQLFGGWHRSRQAGDADYRHVGAQVQRYLDLRRGRVLVVRAWAEGVDVAATDQVPYTELPSLGGRRTLRGFQSHRFIDTHALLMTAEYRWPILSSVQAQLFCDWGTVAPSWRTLRPSALDPSVGLAVVGRLANGTAVMVQVARSSEDWQFYAGTGATFTLPQRRRR